MYSLPTSCPALAPYFVGVVVASPEGSDTAVEMRAFVGSEGAEDPPSEGRAGGG